VEFDFDQMLQSGLLNPYFYKELTGTVFELLDQEHREMYVEDAVAMSQLGINNKDDKAYYWMAFHMGGDWLQTIMHRVVNEPMRRKLAAYMYENRERFPLLPSQIDLMDSTAIAAGEMGLPVDREILQGIEARRLMHRRPIRRKKAYPQDWHGSAMLPLYDVRQWMKAMRDIYARASKIGDFNQAFNDVTQNWGKMEKTDFKYWLRFYQEGNQDKYKTARHIPSTEGGYYFPVQSDLIADLPMAPPDVHFAPPKQESDVNDVRMNIEKQRARIISRLNAAEKLLSSLDGQLFAGEDQEFMLKLLQDLKRKVQTANKLRAKSTLFEDFIYRTANLLRVQGRRKAAGFFYKIAQDPSADPTAAMLLGDQPPPPPGGDAAPDVAPPGAPPSGPAAPTQDTTAKTNTEAALKEFFQLLQTGIADVPDTDEQVSPTSTSADMGASAADDEDELVVYAQAAPVAEMPGDVPPPPPAEAAPPEEAPPEGREHRPEIDDVIEEALKNITVPDVVRRLELLSGLFKKREIARQLAIIDMMMDRLGIGTFFPSLGEATRSALESNQYVATRIEDVLSKLRGSLDAQKSERFINEELSTPSPLAPGAESVQQGLQQQEEEEEARRQKRREREEQKLEGQPAPAAPAPAAVPPELQGPARVEQAQPIPIR
jgi:hypothetical protein